MAILEFNQIPSHLPAKGSKVSNGQNSTLTKDKRGLIRREGRAIIFLFVLSSFTYQSDSVGTVSDFLISFPSHDMP